MIRAVLDTNVLVSALLSPNGNEALILFAVRQGLVVPCFSNEILTEYLGVVARPKFSLPPEQTADLMTMLRTRGELVHPVQSEAISTDPGDTKFLDCAFASLADFLVTGNKKHFPESSYGATFVVNASELLMRITSTL